MSFLRLAKVVSLPFLATHAAAGLISGVNSVLTERRSSSLRLAGSGTSWPDIAYPTINCTKRFGHLFGSYQSSYILAKVALRSLISCSARIAVLRMGKEDGKHSHHTANFPLPLAIR